MRVGDRWGRSAYRPSRKQRSGDTRRPVCGRTAPIAEQLACHGPAASPTARFRRRPSDGPAPRMPELDARTDPESQWGLAARWGPPDLATRFLFPGEQPAGINSFAWYGVASRAGLGARGPHSHSTGGHENRSDQAAVPRRSPIWSTPRPGAKFDLLGFARRVRRRTCHFCCANVLTIGAPGNPCSAVPAWRTLGGRCRTRYGGERSCKPFSMISTRPTGRGVPALRRQPLTFPR